MKRIYVKVVDFTVEEVTVLKELGYKFDSKGYLMFDGTKLKLEVLDQLKKLATKEVSEESGFVIPEELLDEQAAFESAALMSQLATDEEEIGDTDGDPEEGFVIPPELEDSKEVGDNDGDPQVATAVLLEETQPENNNIEGGATMLMERIEFDDAEKKALNNLGFRVTNEGIFFNGKEVNFEQKQRMKKELRVMMKYTKIYHSSDIDPSNFNKYSAFVWVSILRRESDVSNKKLVDIIKGITMSQYMEIPNGKLIKLKEAIESSELNADWKNRLVRSINAQ